MAGLEVLDLLFQGALFGGEGFVALAEVVEVGLDTGEARGEVGDAAAVAAIVEEARPAKRKLALVK